MMTLITKEYASQFQFYQMPKAFFQNPNYMPLHNESKLAYMLMLDLLPLSIKNNWVNENNQVFVKISRTKLMGLLNIKGTQKFAKIIKELVDYKLIVYKRVGLSKCNEIYLYPLEGASPKAASPSKTSKTDSPKADRVQDIDEVQSISVVNEVQDLLENQIYIDELKERYDDDFVDEIANNICEMYSNTSTRIGQQNKPMVIIRAAIRKLKMYHIEHVMDKFLEITRTTEIQNTKRYLQTMIYNAIYEANANTIGHIKYNTSLTW